MRIRAAVLRVVAMIFGVTAVVSPAVAQGRANAVGQPVSSPTPERMQALTEAHQAEFDYLLGDWEFSSVHVDFGKARGYWSAVRVAEGPQVLDEFRIVGDSGQTFHASSTLRSYNALRDRWEIVTMVAGSGFLNKGTGHRVGTEMHLEQVFGVMYDRPELWRIRYYDIQPDHFSWSADRSADGGKNWQNDFLHIEARRVGPPRSLGPLTPVNRPPRPTAEGTLR